MTSEGEDILEAGGDGYKPIPEFTSEQIAECTKDEDFMPLAFELYKSFAVAVVQLANTSENHPKHEAARKDLDCQIIHGMLIRITQLMLSVVKLSAEQKHRESIFILKRCIDETALNIMYLLQQRNPELFEKYRRYSLTPEAELFDLVEENIRKRDGRELPIETSMKRSIDRSCKAAKVDLKDVPRKHLNWGGSAKDKCNALGIPDFYNSVMRIPSHSVHGSFVDLIQHYLEEKDGQLVPKDCTNYPDDGLLVTSGVVCSLAAQAYCEAYFFHEETREALLQHFKDYGEAFHDMNGWSIKARHGEESVNPWPVIGEE